MVARAPLVRIACRNASCVLDGMPGPVTSIDVSADGSMVVWTTPEFIFFACLSDGHWEKGKKEPKPAVLQLAVRPEDLEAMASSEATGDEAPGEEVPLPMWMPARFDAGTARDDHGLSEREIISYCGGTQVRWSVRDVLSTWAKLEASQKEESGPPPPPPLYASITAVGGSVFRHVTVKVSERPCAGRKKARPVHNRLLA